ncbi:MAG TPA: hypothetical protein VFK10_20860 [Burkholderiaceae bacterium]|nr:hypothetical protein [Burkholderiaceae bacterium]
MAEEYRPTEPVNVYEAPAPPPPPAREGKQNSLLWVAVVVAVFMAVPFLANWATRTKRVVAPSAQAASAPAAPEQAVAEPVAPPANPAPAVPDRPAPVPARAPAEPGRQMVTKCLENGRVVYTQTGQCAGSVSAVPIDTSKNVVGPGAAASSR